MCEPANTPQNAKQLAHKIAEPLEALANIHYLMERESDPQRLRDLQKQDREILNTLLQAVLDVLSAPG